jgi:cysteine dioxygenase
LFSLPQNRGQHTIFLLLRRLDKYEHWNEDVNYTRNLIASDGQTYALILLCWNKGKYSPVHNHPGDGCWMSAIKGQVREVQYGLATEESEGPLVQRAETTYSRAEGGDLACAYIDDGIALHKVGNPSETDGAVTLHLYSPPPKYCRVWKDENKAGCPTSACGNKFHSRYGELCKN